MIGNLIQRLNENAQRLQDVLDTSRCVDPTRIEAGALRLFEQNADLSLNVLESLNDLVAEITSARATILLEQKD